MGASAAWHMLLALSHTPCVFVFTLRVFSYFVYFAPIVFRGIVSMLIPVKYEGGGGAGLQREHYAARHQSHHHHHHYHHTHHHNHHHNFCVCGFASFTNITKRVVGNTKIGIKDIY